MGPRLVSRGDGCAIDADGERRDASMGPRLVSRGDSPLFLPHAAFFCFNGAAACEPRRPPSDEETYPASMASMGPRLVSRGDTDANLRYLHVDIASMGPRLVSRGDIPKAGRRAKASVASMGPRLVSRGDRSIEPIESRISLLQWGRGL